MKIRNDTTEIIAVRHGETEWNRRGIQQGHLDSTLTARGEIQARLAGRRLALEKIDALYCSDIGRACRTAEIIGSEIGLEPVRDEGVRERNLGMIQGMTLDEFRLRHPEEHARFISRDPDYAVPGGETVRERYERSVASVARISAMNRGRRIVIVMHGGNIDSLFRHATGFPLDRPRNFSLYNAALNRFLISGDDWFLQSWGDISHLLTNGALDDY
ncbi:MAG TPA: histidine phosphatase family protein [Spirochaetota bacterium]|nr:histidine phosphatase family protein [Spirochaetota bacterium]HRZ25532.1 histidine phosphatase family protein [Spirochaetota bacterium]HSA13642.1 histidine phosphatase family protein [Spirochaetota bacterium]